MPGWLTRSLADVPLGEEWLGPRERDIVATLRVDRRRSDWLLGRFTAKAAVSAWLSVAPQRVEILPAPDGAPEAWVDGEPAPVSVSLSHRAARALAVVAQLPSVVGCDLERVEPRSGAFVREWLAPAEQGLLAAHPAAQRPLLANLVWSAKEAAAKVRREGLRLDVRGAIVAPGAAGADDRAWWGLSIEWPDRSSPTLGWWRSESRWVMAIAGDPPPPRPQDAEMRPPSESTLARWR